MKTLKSTYPPPEPPSERLESKIPRTYYRKNRAKRAQRVLDAHYRNLLSGGELVLVKELKYRSPSS